MLRLANSRLVPFSSAMARNVSFMRGELEMLLCSIVLFKKPLLARLPWRMVLLNMEALR